MPRPLLLVAAVALAFGAATAEAAKKQKRPCERQPPKNCEMRKHPTCGPIALKFWKDGDGVAHCDSATVLLTTTAIIPELRRLRCFLYGETSDIRFSTTNYRTVEGPRDGDTIRMSRGHAQVTVHGHYDSSIRASRVTFENRGPGSNVLLKCQGFGPA